MRLHTTACVTLALAALSTSVAAAEPQKIAVTVKIDKKFQSRLLTADELATMLKGSGFDDATIKNAVAAGQRDGRLMLQAKVNTPTADNNK